MQHSFNVELAKEYGVLEAILLNHLWFWIKKNKANNTTKHTVVIVYLTISFLLGHFTFLSSALTSLT